MARRSAAVRRGRWHVLALGLAVLALAAGAVADAIAGVAQEAVLGRENVQVIAQGVVAVPAGDVIWRVAYHDAAPEGEARAGRRDLGFVLADEGRLLVEEEDGEPKLLLAPGEAALTRRGAEQRRAAVGEGPAAYYALDLVPAAAGAVGDGAAVFASPPFAVPTGERDIELLRSVLASDEGATIAAGEAPTLVLATAGVLRVEASDGAAASLAAGEASVFGGDLTVQGDGETDAAFVAAVVRSALTGPSTPAAASPAATPDATPAASDGSIAAVVHACPAEARPNRFNPAQCERDPGAVQLRVSAIGGQDPDDARVRDGVPTWSGVAFGEYLLQATGFAPGFDRFFVPGLEAVGAGDEPGLGASPSEGYRLRLTPAAPDFRLDVYAFRPDDEEAAATARPIPTVTPRAGTAGGGSIAFRVYACPGVTLTTFDPAACAPAAGYDVALSGGAIPAPLTLADAAPGPAGTLVWDGLAFGQYVFTVPVLPAGAATYFVPGSAAVGLLADNSGYAVAIDASAPNIVLDVYALGPAPAPPLAPPPTPVPLPPTPVPPPAAVPEAPPPTPVPAPTEAPVVDSDGDGLTDDVEIGFYGTDPARFDTDGDGAGDGAEVAVGTDPFAAAAPEQPAPTAALAPPADGDGDGLADVDEAAYGANPAAPDTDGDGFNDGTEVTLGTDPANSSDVPEGA